MDQEIKDTIAMLLVSNVLILANQLRQEDRAKGTTRVGGDADYTQAAAKYITEKRSAVFHALGRR